MDFALLHPREQLVAIMERIYRQGMTTLSGGNLSIRDEDGSVWITPAGVDKGKLAARDMMCVCTDGTVEGPHRPSSEYPFHRAIYARRPDLRAVVHAHPPATVAFSIARQVPDTRIIPQANRVCGPVGYAPYALPGSEQLGAHIAGVFAQGHNVVILENHGLAAGGETLLEAFQRLETLEFCARTLIQAHGLGTVSTLDDDQLALFDHRQHHLPTFVPTWHSSRECELRQQMVEIVRRACDRGLMISTEGVASARLDENSFLITPTGMDRRSLEIEDIVLVADGHREQDKLPSRSVDLHRAIYRHHAEVGSVLTAQAPNATAYAIVDPPFDTRTIPESYVLLREIPKIPFGVLYRQPEQVAAQITARTPVLIARNDCVLTTGTNLLQAFDRLEVAESSARALIDTRTRLGALVPIGDDELCALERAFGIA